MNISPCVRTACACAALTLLASMHALAQVAA